MEVKEGTAKRSENEKVVLWKCRRDKGTQVAMTTNSHYMLNEIHEMEG
jgi:hypothetical protein